MSALPLLPAPAQAIGGRTHPDLDLHGQCRPPELPPDLNTDRNHIAAPFCMLPDAEVTVHHPRSAVSLGTHVQSTGLHEGVISEHCWFTHSCVGNIRVLPSSSLLQQWFGELSRGPPVHGQGLQGDAQQNEGWTPADTHLPQY